MGESYWYMWDEKTKMWAICSEYRGGYFLYTPDETVAHAMINMFNSGEKGEGNE